MFSWITKRLRWRKTRRRRASRTGGLYSRQALFHPPAVFEHVNSATDLATIEPLISGSRYRSVLAMIMDRENTERKARPSFAFMRRHQIGFVACWLDTDRDGVQTRKFVTYVIRGKEVRCVPLLSPKTKPVRGSSAMSWVETAEGPMKVCLFRLVRGMIKYDKYIEVFDFAEEETL